MRDALVLVKQGFGSEQRKRAPFAEPPAPIQKPRTNEAIVQAAYEGTGNSIALYGEAGSAAGVLGVRPAVLQEDRTGICNGVVLTGWLQG